MEQIDTCFNLNVASIGYLFDVIRDEKSHLGLFLQEYRTTSTRGLTLN